MEAFQLDPGGDITLNTSGELRTPTMGSKTAGLRWTDLDIFTRRYIEGYFTPNMSSSAMHRAPKAEPHAASMTTESLRLRRPGAGNPRVDPG